MKYNAFISYSHSDCGNIAPTIQRAIENIGKPWYKLQRSLTVFRDETNLTASPELWNSIAIALDNSDNLILLASPIAKDSFWVNKEIEYWFSKERKGDLFIVLAKGDIKWDYSINDFDLKKTNSLPASIFGKFKTEPLWIDLSEYIKVGQKSLNYKQAGFTSGITKIIGRIIGKPPREIESDELSRKRRTIFVLISSIFSFILLVFLITTFYSQNKISQRNSIANNLIAEGNKYRETDINKTLLLYSYAYRLNKDISTFKILNDFYEKYAFIDTIENEMTKNILIDTLNFFFVQIKNEDSSDSEIIKYPYLNIITNSYTLIENNFIKTYDLKNNALLSNIALKYTINDVASSPNNSNIYLSVYNLNNKLFCIQFDLKTNTYLNLLQGSFLNLANINIDNSNSSIDKANFQYKISKPNYNNLLIIQSPSDNSNKLNLIKYNFKSKMLQTNRIHIPNPLASGYEMIEISNDGNFVFFKNIYSNYEQDLILDLTESRVDEYFGGQTRKFGDDNNHVSCVSFDSSSKFIILGFEDGKIMQHFLHEDNYLDNGEINDFDRYSEDRFDKVTAITNYKNLIISGYSDGSVAIYRNTQSTYSGTTFGTNIELIRRIQLSHSKNNMDEDINKIESIALDNKSKVLYITTSYGSIFKIKLNKLINLTKDSNKIIPQIINEMGLIDLTKEEKLELNIID